MGRTVLSYALLMVCGAALADPVIISEKILPPGEHRDLVVRTCAACHAPELVVAKRRTEADWDDIIARMVERGAVATEDEQLLILDYFVQHFGVNDTK